LSEPKYFELRPAVEGDFGAIKALIRAVQINPMGLHWQNFLVATDSHGQLIGCGQIKPHQDGSCELASIAVVEHWRRGGIASRIIMQLIDGHHGLLYLTCRSTPESSTSALGLPNYPTICRPISAALTVSPVSSTRRIN
jgi:hypothetical protein